MVDPEELISDYSAAAAWKWQNTDTFVLRGRARLQGENQVFSGPFILLGSRTSSRLRADFCGPDGSPLLSISGDSTGFIFYYPDEGSAYFSPGGLPVNNGVIPVNAVVSLLRTGFPAEPVPWQMSETGSTAEGGSVNWTFTAGVSDSLLVTLAPGELFPRLESGGTALEVTAASWHDAFNAWPMEWSISSPSISVVARLRTFEECLPQSSQWELEVPVRTDTLREIAGRWEYFPEPSIR